MKKLRLFLVYALITGILLGNGMSAFAVENDEVEEVTEGGAEEEISEDEIDHEEYVITGFEELSKTEYEWKERPSLEEILDTLPKTLTVEIDSEREEEIEITWECTDDYEETEFDIYEFLPFWDEDIYVLSNSLHEYWDVPSVLAIVPVPMSEEEKEQIEEAKEALQEILEDETVQALVYLCEKYAMKEDPDSESGTVTQLSTGTTVQIEDVHVDEARCIWYKVSCNFENKSYTGYIERDYLAYSNEAFKEWEGTYLSAYTMQLARYSISYADVEQFPDSYQSELMELKKAHPNWVFVKQNTGLDWQAVVNNENSKDRNLISSTMGAAYKGSYYGQGWYYASEAAIKYYMDPRNFLDDTRIFQFEQLTFNGSYHTQAAVQNILNDTFMEGAMSGEDSTYAQAFYEIGSVLGVSPFHLASRVYQEQGKGTSPLISGEYEGYEGYYNYFNVGASGKTDKEVIVSGLTYAKSKGWSSRYLSLKGGASVLATNYILKGQDTLYLQKFNVDGRYHGLYNHQYMQNVRAPYTEAPKIKTAYANTGALENSFVFKIPVYTNMPSDACPVPGTLATPAPTATLAPTPTPTATPTMAPTVKPTATPTPKATVKPTATPTMAPTVKPTATPTPKATVAPTATLTPAVAATATSTPSAAATSKPTATPTAKPVATVNPTEKPEENQQNTDDTQERENQLIQIMPQPTAVATQAPAATEAPVEITQANQEDTQTSTTAQSASTAQTSAPIEGRTVALDMSKNTKLYSQTLEKLKEEGTTVVLTMDDVVSWTVDGNSIVSDSLEDIDFAVTVGSSQIPADKIEELTREEEYIELSLAHEGEFGFDAVLTVSLDIAQEGQYANLFYYNEETKEFEFMCASSVNEKKQVAFTFKHASDYVIMISDETLEKLPGEIRQEKEALEAQKEAIRKAEIAAQEAPAKEPVKAAGIIALILLMSVAIGIGVFLVYSKKK